MIENAIKYVKQAFADDCSGHDYHHTMRVYRLAVQIAKQENADVQIVQLTALLHDVDDAKLSPETYAAKKNAVAFMKSNGVDKEIMENVCRMRTDWMQWVQLELQERLLMVVVKVERYMTLR